MLSMLDFQQNYWWVNLKERVIKILPQSIPEDIRHLYWSALIFNFGQAMVLLFEPIYLYQSGYSISAIIWYFLLVYVVYFFIIQLGANFAEYHGYEKSMLYSTVIWVIYFICLIAIPTYPILFFLAPLFLAGQKALYWPAYHAFFARYINATEKGKEISSVFAMVSVVYIIAPVVSGLLVESFNFATMFIVAMLILLCSNLPLLKHLHSFKAGSYAWKQHWQNLFSFQFRRRLMAVMGYGEEFIVLVLWPVFISIFLPKQLDFGLLIAASTLATAIIDLFIGRYTDALSPVIVLERGSILYAGSWLARLFVTNPVTIFFTDLWSRVSKDMIAVPLSALIYSQAQKQPDHGTIMSEVALHETALIMGKVAAAIVCLILLAWLPAEYAWTVIFSVAVLFSILYVSYQPGK